MKRRDVLELGGNVAITVADAATGAVLEQHSVHNRVLLATRNGIRDVLDGVAGLDVAPDRFALGTDDTPVTDVDAALGAEVLRDVVTLRTPDVAKLTLKYYLSSGQANGNTLAEAGLLNAAGNLLARATHAPIVKSAAVTVSYVWELTVGAG